MKSSSRQRGMTLISLALLMVILGFLGMLVLRLGPIYLENYTVKSVLQGLKSEPGLGSRSPAEIRQMVDNRLYVNEVRRIGRQEVVLKREGNVMRVSIDYKVTQHIMANVDAVVSFSDSVELPVN